MACANAPGAVIATAKTSRKRRICLPSLQFLEPAHPNGMRRSGQGGRPSPAPPGGSEEVPDREFEQIGVVDGAAGQREPDLEAERTQRGEPAHTEADAVEKAERQGPAALRALEEVLLLRERVSGVEEADAAEASAAEDGKLDLPVRDQLLVAADGKVDDRRVRLEAAGDLQRGRDAAQDVAADGVDAAFEELLADRDRVGDRLGRADVAERDVGLEDQPERKRPVEALDQAVPLEEILAAEDGRGELGGGGLEVSGGGEQAVVATIVVEGEPDARGPPRPELVREHLLGAGRGLHRHLLQGVGDEHAEVFQPGGEIGEVVSRREGPSVRLAIEPGEEQLAPIEVDRSRPLRVEDVGVEVAELEELADAGDLQRERRGVTVAEQVVLRELRLPEEVLAAGETETDLEGAGHLLLHRHFEEHLVVGGAAL